MKTQSLVLAAAIATIMSAPTMATEWFVGGGLGAQQNTHKSTAPSVTGNGTTSSRDTENNITYELRGGAFLNENNRVYGTYSINSDHFSRQQSLLISYDYLVSLGESNKLNWFVGATAGVNHFSPKTDELSSKNRFVWGGQTGLMYKFTDNISTEFGYRYLKQDHEFKASEDTHAFNLDNSQQVYLAVDYRF